MHSNQDEVLTQDDLVEKLRQRGYGDASLTSVASWRKVDLLPQFSNRGKGHGRGAGREKSYWSDATNIVEQAIAIMDLRRNYRSLEELYLPLWQMGFAIPLDRIRPALLQPLLDAEIPYDVQEDGRTTLEDVIDESVAEISPVLKREAPIFDVPTETVAALINVVTNPDYKLSDEPYEYGIERLKEWEGSLAERLQNWLGDGIVINQEAVGDDSFFAKAPFINQYLALPHLIAATQDCTDAELKVVQQDLLLGREILLIVNRIRELLTPFMPDTFQFSSEDMKVVFDFGRLIIWVDLALRRRGFGPLIDQLIPLALNELHQVFNETAERELVAAGPEIGKAFHMVEQLMVTAWSPDPHAGQ